MSQLRQRKTELDELDVRVKVVTFDADFMALQYVKRTRLPWPLLLDPDQTLYDGYGMRFGRWWDIYSPLSIWKYIKLIIQGQKPGKPGRDWRQLGGDVLIDPQGIVQMHYVSDDPHDRPAVDSILEIVAANSNTET